MRIFFFVLLLSTVGIEPIPLGAQGVHNPYIKYDWSGGDDYKITYGELSFDEDWDCSINDAEDLTNEKAIQYLLEGIEREIQLLPMSKRNVLFYIHGKGGHMDQFARYNNAMIQKDLMSKKEFPYGILIPFRWKGTFNYPDNIPKCVEVGYQFAALIKDINAIVQKHNPDAFQSIICHSMGNRVFMGIYKSMYDEGLRAQFRNFIAAAPDIEPDVFYEGQPMDAVCELVDHVSVYTHNTDRVLTVSEKWGNGERLGLRGIDDLDAINECIDVVDASLLNDNEEFNIGNHRYYTESPTARRDMYHILAEHPDSLSTYRKVLDNENRFLMLFEEK